MLGIEAARKHLLLTPPSEAALAQAGRLLEIELPSEHTSVSVPAIFDSVREVPFVKGFSNRRIAAGSLTDFDYDRLIHGSR